jgi:hypothetical protein
MLCKRCRSTHKEGGKIGFAFLGFFYDFIWFSQSTGPKGKSNKNLFSLGTLERFESSQKSPWSSQPWPYGEGELAGGGAGSEGENKWGGVRLSSQGVDWWRLVGRRCSRRWPVARPRRRLRPDSDPGEMWGPTRPCVGVGAQVGLWKSATPLVGHKCKRRGKFTDGGNNGRRQSYWRARRKGGGDIGMTKWGRQFDDHQWLQGRHTFQDVNRKNN